MPEARLGDMYDKDVIIDPRDVEQTVTSWKRHGFTKRGDCECTRKLLRGQCVRNSPLSNVVALSKEGLFEN